MWVYSGRRGVHCWISDERARKLTQEARRALVSYLEVIKVSYISFQ
jgi:DNA primase small subunit